VMTSVSIKNIIRATVPRSIRNFLRSPSRSMDWVLDWTKFSLGVTNSLSLANGWSIVCHPYAYRAGQSLVLDPAYKEEFQAFLSCCHSRMLLFDIGAHFGFFSLAAAHHGGDSIALDPSPVATRMIAIQAVLNECARNIQVLPAAASDANGTVEMLSAGSFSYGFFRVGGRQSRPDLSRVAAVTIDHLVQKFGEPTHIKIDVEGHEGAVLRGARATLNACSPLIFLELHNDMIRAEGEDPNSIAQELSSVGYVPFGCDGREIERASLAIDPIARVLFRRP